MRNRIASAYKNPAVRFIAIALLAGTAAGCSSDATRFDSFYQSADNLSTGSIRGSGVSGQVPTPSANVASAGNLPPRSDLSDPMNQPIPPAQANAQYGQPLPVSSNARVVSSSPVQSAALGAPLPPAAPSGSAPVRQAQAQSAPAAPSKGQGNIRMIKGPDPISTGTVSASQPAQGKQIAALEPKASESVKTAQAPGKVPVPAKGPKQEAVLPSAPQPEKKKVATAEAKDGAKGNTHKVASGESLIAIAKKNGVTVEALRAANGLTSNAVRAGQELKIPSADAAKVAEKPATEKVTADDMTTASVSGKPDAPLKPKATQAAAAAAAAPEAKESVSAAAGTQVASTAPAETGIGKYRWPATGAVIAAYGANVDGQRNDGIDISVPEGTPVKAAENGVVIYAGNGLEKLGNTVLIRHSDGKVTVYAHLKSIDVNRGDKVNRGQVVAGSGMSGSASRPKLHFEVRKNSAPINPMSFLE